MGAASAQVQQDVSPAAVAESALVSQREKKSTQAKIVEQTKHELNVLTTDRN